MKKVRGGFWAPMRALQLLRENRKRLPTLLEQEEAIRALLRPLGRTGLDSHREEDPETADRRSPRGGRGATNGSAGPRNGESTSHTTPEED